MKTGGFPGNPGLLRAGPRCLDVSFDTPSQIPPGLGWGPVRVLVARAARGIRPLTLTGAARAPGGIGALRVAEVTNG
jgi:hypothetical protein